MSNTAVITRASRYGRFRPQQLRATGGFSDVYLARDNTGKVAALKVFRTLSSDTGSGMERFRREKLILERVGSRRVSRLLDADLEATPPWIASEYVEGPTLREAIAQQGPFNRELSVSVLSLLSETLADIHDLGIAHRDLNPNNIILSKEGPTLIDFGSAQLLATGQANFSLLSVGTPGYISPEQLNGEPATLASDVYSFGKVASFLVSGETTDQNRQRFAIFANEQEEILRRCLHSDPRERPGARELRRVFASSTESLAAITGSQFKSPELRKVPRGQPSTILVLLAACLLLIGTLGVWRVSTSNETTTGNLVDRLAADHRRYQDPDADLIPRLGEFGVFQSMLLPASIDVARSPRNYSYFDFGFLDYFEFVGDEIDKAALAVYTMPSASPPSYAEIVGQETTPRLVNLQIFGEKIYERVTGFQSEFVPSECALDIPKTVSTDIGRGLIRHVASAPVCEEFYGRTTVAFSIHDWYPNRNLLFEFTGLVDIAVLDPIQVLDSLVFIANLANPVAQPTTRLSLPDLSIYREGASLIGGQDGNPAFFYANIFVNIPPLASLNLDVKAPEDSSALFSFTAYQQSSGPQKLKPLPAGRLFAHSRHQLRFDNPDTTSLVLSFEIDSLGAAPPDVFVSKSTDDARQTWLLTPSFSLGIGQKLSDIDYEIQIMLPTLIGPEIDQTTNARIGETDFPIPTDLQPTSSEELALAGFTEFWSVDSPYREDDLPHLQVTTNQFSEQVDGSPGEFWVSDPAFLACKQPVTFSYSATRSVEWSLFTECKVADVLQQDNYQQIQASPILKFVVYDRPKSEVNENTVAYRGIFVPGSHQHLAYLKELLKYFASTSL